MKLPATNTKQQAKARRAKRFLAKQKDKGHYHGYRE